MLPSRGSAGVIRAIVRMRVRIRNANRWVREMSIGSELPVALRALNADERIALSVLKVNDVAC